MTTSTNLIFCVGVDNKKHVCNPTDNKTVCGIPIKRKKELKYDYKLFNCYQCDYMVDQDGC